MEAARALVGAQLVGEGPALGRRAGIVTEVEAYIGEEDLASHARFGQTARNGIMYGPPGMAYVYLVYGMYDCLNVVTEPPGRPAAVLIRAVAPTEGVDLMRASRVEWTTGRRRVIRPGEAERIAKLPAERLASGPGLVCAAFGIDRTVTGTDLCDPASTVRLEAVAGDVEVAVSPRIGVDYAGAPWTEVPWRLFTPGDPSVSEPRRR